ncbi:hypothetical protein BGZ73_006897 [Actinomortierella ambigua]|nr:hypothetical protein BGZ73_006897 [Actinomortierella ambigua]
MENDGEDGEGDEKGDSLSQQGKGPKKHGGSGKKSRKRSISEQWICNDLPPKLLASSRKAAAAAAAAAAAGKSSVKQQDAPSHYPGGTDGGGGHARNGDVDGHGKVSQASSSTADKGDVEMTDADETAHTASTASRRVTEPSAPVRHGSHSHDEEEEHDELDEDDIPSSHSKEQSGEVHYIEDEDDDGDDEQVSFLQQDPLFVLHASLWSEDGSQVRSMIATPGQQDPPKLTRILMGSIVVSPILLNNTQGEPGWYFSFPDLSIRTEGVYTLKFSLLRFGSFNFNVEDSGKHASEVIDEAISQPFTVFSAKKFPGMTESTELSKTFAKQGLKIPIRNDLRVRKADRD